MKFFATVFSSTILLTMLWSGAFAAVSVSIGDPGFYGQVDIGGYPDPRLIHGEPVIIHRGAVSHAPIYLRVPPGHSKNWRRYCNAYNACGRPVYFVDDVWYRDVYVPHYRTRHPGGRHVGPPPKHYSKPDKHHNPPKRDEKHHGKR